jgi:hypothetical protein
MLCVINYIILELASIMVQDLSLDTICLSLETMFVCETNYFI